MDDYEAQTILDESESKFCKTFWFISGTMANGFTLNYRSDLEEGLSVLNDNDVLMRLERTGKYVEHIELMIKMMKELGK